MYRIVTCQGSIQLVSALSAMFLRDKYRLKDKYTNILVIYDLYCPESQIGNFIETIKLLAEKVHQWDKIVYLSPEDVAGIGKLDSSDTQEILKIRVHDLISSSTTDEIYLSSDVHPTNLLLLKAYPNAYKICFGDGLGIYIPDNYTYLTRKKEATNSLQKLSFLSRISHYLQSRFTTGKDSFNIGYFVFPDIYADKPKFYYKRIPKKVIQDIFSKMVSVLETSDINNVIAKLSGKSIVVLMTSNFSEAQRMSFDNELASYRRFVLESTKDRREVLIIKPHPRDSMEKILALRDTLRTDFDFVYPMVDGILPYIPFELFLLKLLKSDNFESMGVLTVYTFSTSFISLRLLYDVTTKIGYGPELVREYFYNHCAEDRINHESDLQKVATQL
jgi:hypothetical protein